MNGNDFFSNLNFGKLFYCPGASFHPAKPIRNTPKLSENLKIDDFQFFFENLDKFPKAFLNKSVIKF